MPQPIKNLCKSTCLSVLILVILAILVGCENNCPAPRLSKTSDRFILEDVNLVDLAAGEIRERVDILIEGRTITTIKEHSSSSSSDSTQRIHLRGKYVIPGLIEGHTHLTPLPEQSLTLALRQGVVAVRDMAGDGAYLKDLQAAVHSGELMGPDIYFSAIMGGRDLILNDSRVKLATPPSYELGQAPWARLVDENSDIPQVIADAKACGATGIKLYAYLSETVVRQLTDEAKRQRLKVWAHAVIYPATANDVINAGVDVISHAAFFLLPSGWKFADGSRAMDPAQANTPAAKRLIASMKEHNVVFDPTLIVTRAMTSGITDPERVSAIKKALYELTKASYDAGVMIIAGTDSPLPKHENERLALHEEMELLVDEVGLTPLAALRAATINNAKVLGMDDILGLIEPGRPANLVVLNGDPLGDIHNIENVAFVIKNGNLVN